jgi:hypothetical protein
MPGGRNAGWPRVGAVPTLGTTKARIECFAFDFAFAFLFQLLTLKH